MAIGCGQPPTVCLENLKLFSFTTSLGQGRSPYALLERLSFVCPKSLSLAAAAVRGASKGPAKIAPRARQNRGEEQRRRGGGCYPRLSEAQAAHLSVMRGSGAGKGGRGVSCRPVFVHTVFV